jgi:hypothetical protein
VTNMRFTIIPSFLHVSAPTRADKTVDAVEALRSASEHMSPEAAAYARQAADHWSAAENAERNLPASF